MLSVPPVLVGTIDHHREFDGPLVLAVGRREIVSDLTTPACAEFVFDLTSPLDHRNDVREIVCLKQRETLAVVKATVEVDRFDVEVEVVRQSKELSEDIAGGVAVGETAHRQGVSLVVHACVECGVSVERSCSCFGLAVVEAVSLVFVTVVRSQVEVSDDLRLLGKCFEDILLEKRVPG